MANDLKGNENWLELAGDSSYRGFELPRVKLQYMYDENPGEIDFGSSYLETRHFLEDSEMGTQWRQGTFRGLGKGDPIGDRALFRGSHDCYYEVSLTLEIIFLYKKK